MLETTVFEISGFTGFCFVFWLLAYTQMRYLDDGMQFKHKTIYVLHIPHTVHTAQRYFYTVCFGVPAL